MPVVRSDSPTVSVTLPVPTPVNPRPRAPVSLRANPPQPAPQPGPTGVPPVQPQPATLSAVILPWGGVGIGKRTGKLQGQVTVRKRTLSRLPRRVVRYSATPTSLVGLFRAAREDPYNNTRHAVIADALDEAYPGNHISGLIRRQFGFGEHGGQGERNNEWYDAVQNSWDGTFPYAARLGEHAGFNLYLEHAQEGEGETPRWILHAVSKMHQNPAHDDFGYTFEFPHEEAHLIPRMFPGAAHFINSQEGEPVPGGRNGEVRHFNDTMDEQERNR